MAKKAAKSAKSPLKGEAAKMRNKEIERTKRYQEKAKEPMPITIVSPPTTTEQSGAPVDPGPGKVTVQIPCKVQMNFTSPTTAIRVDLEHLGTGWEADTVAEISGNHKYLDEARPPVIEDNYLIVFFNTNTTVPGIYNMEFLFTWEEDMEAVTPKPLKEGKYDGIEPPKKTRKAKSKR